MAVARYTVGGNWAILSVTVKMYFTLLKKGLIFVM